LFVAGLGFSGWLVKSASTQLTNSSSELSTLRKEIADLDKKREGLEKAKVVLADNTSTLLTLSKVIPVDKDQAKIVEEIYAIADNAGVTIDSVGFPASTLGNQAAKPTATATTQGTTTPSGSTPTTTATPQKSISQATPLKDIPGVQSIELSIGAINSKSLPPSSGVRYAELMSFIRQIERNERAIQITAIGIGQDKVVNNEPTFSLTISLTIFVKS
jgi:hypothetical protein